MHPKAATSAVLFELFVISVTGCIDCERQDPKFYPGHGIIEHRTDLPDRADLLSAWILKKIELIICVGRGHSQNKGRRTRWQLSSTSSGSTFWECPCTPCGLLPIIKHEAQIG